MGAQKINGLGLRKLYRYAILASSLEPNSNYNFEQIVFKLKDFYILVPV